MHIVTLGTHRVLGEDVCRSIFAEIPLSVASLILDRGLIAGASFMHWTGDASAQYVLSDNCVGLRFPLTYVREVFGAAASVFPQFHVQRSAREHSC